MIFEPLLSFITLTSYFNQGVSAGLVGQRVKDYSHSFPLKSRNKPNDILELISDNLDINSQINLRTTSKLFKDLNEEKIIQRKIVKTLETECGKSLNWTLTQNGHSIFASKEREWISFEQEMRCLQAIILNHKIVKPRLKHLTVYYPKGSMSNERYAIPYYDALETLLNRTDHLESITLRSKTQQKSKSPLLE